jgi:hypothetical protein
MEMILVADDSPQSLGGQARSQSLSREQRKEIARQGALARWNKVPVVVDPDAMPEATHQGELPIGDVKLDCYVLEDGRRLFHKRGMARALTLKSDGGNAFLKTISGKGIGSAITPELREKIENPIVFKPLNGDPAHGYEAGTLIEVLDAIIQARNDLKLLPNQMFLALQAEIIIRSAAKVGIVALIDESTGFIADKRKAEYRELFQQYIADEIRQWDKEFPDEFFDMIYRLYGLKRINPNSFKHPVFFSKFIRKYIYKPLANSNGAILEELESKNPVVYSSGGRRHKLFQFLSDQVGLPAFRQHLWKVVGIGAGAPDKAMFDKAFDRAFPQANSQIDMFSN